MAAYFVEQRQADIDNAVIIELDNSLHEISKIMFDRDSTIKIPSTLSKSFTEMYDVSSALVKKIKKGKDDDKEFFNHISELKSYLLKVAQQLTKHVNTAVLISTIIYNSDLI